MIGSHLHAFWNDLWPNTIAPPAWTLTAVILSHIRAARQRQRHHEDMKRHVAETVGGAPDSGSEGS